MKALLKKVVISALLVSLGFFISSCTNRSEVAKATVSNSSEWIYERVRITGRFESFILTDPDTGIQYIVLYDENIDGDSSVAITPRLTIQP